MRKFAPAIAAGDTVVLKPGDTTPTSTLMLAEFVPDGGFKHSGHDKDFSVYGL